MAELVHATVDADPFRVLMGCICSLVGRHSQGAVRKQTGVKLVLADTSGRIFVYPAAGQVPIS